MVFANLLEAAVPCWSRRLGDSGFGPHHFLNCRSPDFSPHPNALLTGGIEPHILRFQTSAARIWLGLVLDTLGPDDF